MIFYSNTERFRDWESLRNPNEYRFSKDINKVVVSECGNVVVNNLRTIALERLLTLATPRELEVYIPSYHNIELSQLKNDIAFLMIGIESHSFPFSTAKNSFLPRKGLSADGVTPEALESFSTPFMTCGNLVRKLSVLTETSSGRGAIYEGFVYGVKSFLRLYQNLVLTLEKTQNGGRFFQLARHLMKHVLFISKLCNLDQASIAKDTHLVVPKGMDLLLYVLGQTRHVSQVDLELQSISILRSTIAPYLRFLSLWLFHGQCSQSDVEYGIQSNESFLAARDRGFWINAYNNIYDQYTHSYQSVDRPLDIAYITTKVVACGKALNLLRICSPSHPLCTYGVKFRSKLEVVVTPLQERNLRLTCLNYMTEMTEKMKESHLEFDLKRKSEAAQKTRWRQNPFTEPFADPKLISIKENDQAKSSIPVQITDHETKKEEIPILPEKDETKRIEDIKSDLQSYYGGRKSEPPPENSDNQYSRDIKDTFTDEQLLPTSTDIQPLEEENHVTDNIEKCDITKQNKDADDINKMPPPQVPLELPKKTTSHIKDRRPSAKSIISFHKDKKEQKKNLQSTKTVDDCIETTDLEVSTYTFHAISHKTREVVKSNEQPTSTKGLAPLEILVKNSIHIPLMAQLSLINKEILHFFMVDQSLFKNFEAICNYILLKDNEFAFNLGCGISDATEEDKFSLQKHPTSLSRILKNAIHSSSVAAVDPLASNVGFSVNQIISGQDQHCSDIMDMLRLSYSVEWPLNIIITPDMIISYGQIFQLLLRMENVSINLNKSFMELKQHRYLFKDFRFVQLQIIRHRMLNYITIMKSYIRNQIVVACWQEFQRDLKHNVHCLDTLWNVHSRYVHKLLSRAFLRKETQPVRNVLQKTLDTITIFTVILKHDDLICMNGASAEINSDLFEEMKNTYNTFHSLLNLFTSIVSKLETKGYKHHLQEFLACLKIASACGTTSRI